MHRRRRAVLTAVTTAALAVASVATLTLAPGKAAAQAVCRAHPLGAAHVAGIDDGRTLKLADGRTLRLAGIEASAAGRAELQKLAAGQRLHLATLGADHDRYGRLVAYAFAGDAVQSLQEQMIAAGAARVAARVGDAACAAALLAAERAARAGRRGLWADPAFAPIAAANRARLMAQAGRFALVEGKVLSVHPSGTTIYLNFGRRWTKGFSVAILRRSARKLAAAGFELRRLQSHRLLVRGFIERRRGPLIVVTAPEQIELFAH